MVWPAVIGGLAALGGGWLASSAQKKANKQNINLTREQMAWEERMSNTSWQRGTADMRAAGINPMVAFSQGGASTPNTTAAHVVPEDGLSRGISSAGDKAMQALTLQNLQINNQILVEKREQEIIHTANLQGKYPVGEDPNSMLQVEMQRARDEANKVRSEADRAATDANIRKIEEALLEQTFGANVQSAKARSELLAKEVTGADLKNQLMALDIPEKQALAKWFETVGAGSPAMKATMSITQWIRMILGR